VKFLQRTTFYLGAFCFSQGTSKVAFLFDPSSLCVFIASKMNSNDCNNYLELIANAKITFFFFKKVNLLLELVVFLEQQQVLL